MFDDACVVLYEHPSGEVPEERSRKRTRDGAVGRQETVVVGRAEHAPLGRHVVRPPLGFVVAAALEGVSHLYFE